MPEIIFEPLEPHPYSTIIPRHTAEEQHELAEDIGEKGLLIPIVTLKGRDGKPQILDGCGRYEACRAMGVPVATIEYTGDDPMGFVLSMSIRRNLTSAAKYDVARQVLLYDSGRSDRWIARQVGISPTKVGDLRREIESDPNVQSGHNDGDVASLLQAGSDSLSPAVVEQSGVGLATDDREERDSDRHTEVAAGIPGPAAAPGAGHTVPPVSRPPRREASGRVARGVKPGTRRERTSVTAESSSLARDEAVVAAHKMFARNAVEALDNVQKWMKEFAPIFLQKLDREKRREHIRKFAKVLGEQTLHFELPHAEAAE